MLWLLCVVVPVLGFVPPSYNETVWEAFAAKVLVNPFPVPSADPYDDPNFNTTWADSVCAVSYLDSARKTYELVDFPTRHAAESNGSFVTHLHPCGLCSTLLDLSIYMRYRDLTNPVRKCALKSFFEGQKAALECLVKIGFSEPCAKIWLFDALNTRKRCLGVCLLDWAEGLPPNEPPNSTTLNPCIQCDEDKSGPIFKVVAGRTRRDSGLASAINRPPDSIYNVTHYYF
jgi:hypothetical protein